MSRVVDLVQRRILKRFDTETTQNESLSREADASSPDVAGDATAGSDRMSTGSAPGVDALRVQQAPEQRVQQKNCSAAGAFLRPLGRRHYHMPEAVRERMLLSHGEAVHESLPRACTPMTLSPSRASTMGRLLPVVSAAELSAVKRLASFDESVRQDASLPIEIDTSGFVLRHIHDPAKHPPPATRRTLANMSTDYLLSGGAEIDHVPFINSPRSVLVLVRNGATPMDLQLRPEMGAGPAVPFANAMRRQELAKLVAEYEGVCEVLPQKTVDAFFSIAVEIARAAAESSDLHRPVLERDDSGTYHVVVVSEEAPVSTTALKMQRGRARLTALLRAEVAHTQKRTDELRAQQERNLAAAQKHDAQVKTRQYEQHLLLRAKAEATKARRHHRDELVETMRHETLRRHDEKMARNAQQEERTHAAAQLQQDLRRAKEAAKEARRLDILEAARENEERRRADREEVVAFKTQVCEDLLQAKEAERSAINLRRLEAEMAAAERLAAVEAQKEAARAVRQEKQQQREEEAEAQLGRLRHAQETHAELKHLQGLAKSIALEERMLEQHEEREAVREGLIERRSMATVRQQRLLQSLAGRRQHKALQRTEQREAKHRFLESQHRRNQFENLLSADAMLMARSRMNASEHHRTQLAHAAKHEQEQLRQWRLGCLENTRVHAEQQEREATLSVFNRAHPSDAVLLAHVNERAASRLPRSRPSLRPMDEVPELEA